MFGIQIIRLYDILPITSVRNAAGVSPRSLEIQGKDFISVESVLMDGIRSPFFIAHTPNSILAEVPSVLAEQSITEVLVYSAVPTLSARSVVDFTLGAKLRKVNGPQRLLQNFLRLLFRSPGSNAFHRASGGGGLSRIGDNIDKSIAADLVVAVDTTQRYIQSAQAGTRSLPLNERLLAAEVTDITVDPSTTTIDLIVTLTTYAGQRVAANVAI